MPSRFRINARSLVASTAFALALVAGCGPREPSPVDRGAPAPAAPGPAPDLKGVERDLQDLEKAVTPPVIIKPDLPTAPATAPGEAG